MRDEAAAAADRIDGARRHRPLVYRPDIDGLRAVAVLPVVLFHAGIGGFGGGYVGVDVFFVISGYLITRIIAEDLGAGRFSVLAFYERRIRRIVPALVAVIAACTVASGFFFLPEDVVSFARSAMSAVLFSSNIYFFPRSSYFWVAEQYKPLLHTWSLGVEEQFYLFYPLILVAVARWAPRRLLAVLCCVALASFAASALMPARSHNAVFYLAPFRAWELFLGAVVAVATRGAAPRPLRSGLMAVLGLALIAGPVFAYTSETPFPGPTALPPCAGAALLLWAGQGRSNPVSAALGTPVLRFIGQISYSLYLWHWPIIVFGQYRLFPADSRPYGPLFVAASFAAGILSWRFVERPFRRPGLVTTRPVVFGLAAGATAAVLLYGGVAVWTNGLPGRFPGLQARIDALASSYNPKRSRCDSQEAARDPVPLDCVYGDKAVPPRTVVWGDSHGTELVAALGALLAPHSASVLQITGTQCPPALDFFIIWRRRCPAENAATLDFILKHPEFERVVLAAHYSIYATPNFDAFTAGFGRVVAALQGAGRTVILVYPTPEDGPSIPHVIALFVMRGLDPASYTLSRATFEAYNARTIDFLDGLGGPHLLRVHPADALCDAEACRTVRDGKLLYYDADHLDSRGAALVAALFAPILHLP